MKQKMLTADRLALLVLAVALVVWAVVALVRRSAPAPAPLPVVSADSIHLVPIENADTPAAKPEAKRSNGKKKKTATGAKPSKSTKSKKTGKDAEQVPQRDHLREPISSNP